MMPGWRLRAGIMIHWTLALLFRPDIVRISLESAAALLPREAAGQATRRLLVQEQG